MDIQKALGFGVDDVECLVAEAVDDRGGQCFADAVDQSGGQVETCGTSGRRPGALADLGLELAAMAGVAGPGAGQAKALPRLRAEQGFADRGDRSRIGCVVGDGQAEHGVVVVGDMDEAVDDSVDPVTGRGRWGGQRGHRRLLPCGDRGGRVARPACGC
ncbi:hypothetical protein ACFV42_40810 [Streptomyces solisilvae]|uniref:hypothetical protein n=1 Tax=Streptomyces malaysiensis TaxID=92644 RepID=UPI00368B6A23